MSRGHSFQTSMPVKVATYDIDYAGHVSNIVYFRWLEDLRLKLLEENFPLEVLMNEGYMPILAASTIEYKRPVKLFDNPSGFMWIEKLGSATMHFRGEFRVAEQVTTIATHVGLFIDPVSHKPKRLPPVIVRAFAQAESEKQ